MRVLQQSDAIATDHVVGNEIEYRINDDVSGMIIRTMKHEHHIVQQGTC